MAFALSGNPFSAVLQTLREQSNSCRSLSYRLIKDERHYTQALHRSQPSRPLQVALTAVRQQAQEPSSSSEFFSAKTAFEQLGYDATVCQAIRRAGLEQPSRVQELSSTAILKGRSVGLAAETGSGKTLAYLAPLISSLLKERRNSSSSSGSSSSTSSSATSTTAPSSASKHERHWVPDGILVLCPNAALSSQVMSFAESLQDAEGNPLVRSARLASSIPLPLEVPDLVVATPAGLMNATTDLGPYAGWEWTKSGIVSRMRHVVLDEADLLLTGGYEKDTQRILQAFLEGDRQQRASAAAERFGLTEDMLQRMPRLLRKAAQKGDQDALKRAGLVTPTSPEELEADLAGMAQERSAGEASSSGRDESGEQAFPQRTWTRQYIFVAATMPSGEGKSVASDLSRMMPDLQWLTGQSLHEGQPRVSQSWLPVTHEARVDALKEAVLADGALGKGQGRTLVFVGNVAAADEVAAVLQEAGLQPLLYHKEVSAEDRASALSTMRSREGVVMVCTDAAARGIDIPHVTHVVQSSFAATAVDFLHRVGRTGRAGNAGRVTSLYLPEQAILAEAIRAAIDAGEPIEGAFSRNRSFSKKVKKYGKYVPRGQIPQHAAR